MNQVKKLATRQATSISHLSDFLPRKKKENKVTELKSVLKMVKEAVKEEHQGEIRDIAIHAAMVKQSVKAEIWSKTWDCWEQKWSIKLQHASACAEKKGTKRKLKRCHKEVASDMMADLKHSKLATTAANKLSI